MKKLSCFLSLLLFINSSMFAQVGINVDNSAPDNSAMLDVRSANKGMLIPQVMLDSTTLAAPVTDPAISLMVYNTATAHDVTPGYYYWNGSAWTRLIVSAGDAGTQNYLPKWSSASALGNSQVFDNGTNVGIGKYPSKKLDIAGEMQATGTGNNYFAGNVGIGTASPAASAALDITSNTKGFLPPRMTSLDRDAIASPSQGLVIYCTNCGTNGELQVYNGTAWTNMTGGSATAGTLTVGMTCLGGKLAYILQAGDPGYILGESHGLIAAPSDQSSGAQWGCYGTAISGADGTVIGTGNQNTIDIMAGCSAAGIAARICGDLVLNGYSDWYLPSKDELNKLYLNRAAIGGFAINFYWSSSEVSSNTAWGQSFASGVQPNLSKSGTWCVRAIRAF